MAEAVYIVCALTSAACALLLFRAYSKNRIRLLFWSSFCFAALAINNIIVFIDLVLMPQTDLFPLRTVVGLIGLGGLLFALIWETR